MNPRGPPGRVATNNPPAASDTISLLLPAKRLLELFLVARVLLARGWCQGASARNIEGESVDTSAPEATQWSLLGALYCASIVLWPLHTTSHRQRYRALDDAAAFLWSLLSLDRQTVGERLALDAWAADPCRLVAEIMGLLGLAVTQAESAWCRESMGGLAE
jgi:hypothetical protein